MSGPGSLQLCSVALQVTPQAQLDPGWVPALAAAHADGELCESVAVLRGQEPGDVVKRIWLNTVSCSQFSV